MNLKKYEAKAQSEALRKDDLEAERAQQRQGEHLKHIQSLGLLSGHLHRNFQRALIKEAIEFNDLESLKVICETLPDDFHQVMESDRDQMPLLHFCAKHGSFELFELCAKELKWPWVLHQDLWEEIKTIGTPLNPALQQEIPKLYTEERLDPLLIDLFKSTASINAYPDALKKAQLLLQLTPDWEQLECMSYENFEVRNFKAFSEEEYRGRNKKTLPKLVLYKGGAEALEILIKEGFFERLKNLPEQEQWCAPEDLFKEMVFLIYSDNGHFNEQIINKIKLIMTDQNISPNEIIKYKGQSYQTESLSLWNHLIARHAEASFLNGEQKCMEDLMSFCLEQVNSISELKPTVNFPVPIHFIASPTTQPLLVQLIDLGFDPQQTPSPWNGKSKESLWASLKKKNGMLLSEPLIRALSRKGCDFNDINDNNVSMAAMITYHLQDPEVDAVSLFKDLKISLKPLFTSEEQGGCHEQWVKILEKQRFSQHHNIRFEASGVVEKCAALYEKQQLEGQVKSLLPQVDTLLTQKEAKRL